MQVHSGNPLNQFAVSREKVTPRESKQNIKCSQYNPLYLQNHGKVFHFYSSSLILLMFLQNLHTFGSFHLLRTDV